MILPCVAPHAHLLCWRSIVSGLMAAAAEAGCYKVILDCDPANQSFYEKLHLQRKGLEMVLCWSAHASHAPSCWLSGPVPAGVLLHMTSLQERSMAVRKPARSHASMPARTCAGCMCSCVAADLTCPA